MKFPEKYRVETGIFSSVPGGDGLFMVNLIFKAKEPVVKTSLLLPGHIQKDDLIDQKVSLAVIASSGMGWDHVSVTVIKSDEPRCPTWEEMEFIKDLFFEPEETAYQIHAPASSYVNNHPYCLHIWKKQDFEMPLPDPEMLGMVTGKKDKK